MSESMYIHGTSPAEQARLEVMNGILNERCLAEVALRGDERVLEMGAGTGLFARDLARAVPDGRVVAVERDPDQLAQALRRAAGVPNLEVRAGDACAPPLSDDEQGTFDVAHTRFLLEHLERPAEAVRALARAVRPGGRVVLVDDDHSLMRFHPELPAFAELWDVYAAQYARLGCDPFVGRRLVSFLVEAGLTPARTTQIDYGACAGEPHFEAVVRNLVEVVGGARDTVVAGADWTPERFDAALDEVRAWSLRPDATVWYALPAAEGRRG